MAANKQTVKAFYETFGWSKDERGLYQDTATWVDTRPVLNNYYHRTLMRVRNFLRPSGGLYLDAGSGPIGHPEYLTYSACYQRRICVDLAFQALKEARSRVPQGHGSYAVADLTHMPFRDNTFDAAVSAHVIYHIPAEEQALAVTEIVRVLAPSSRAVLIYARSDAVTERIPELTIGNLYRLRDFLIRASGGRWLWRRTLKPLIVSRRQSPTAMPATRPHTNQSSTSGPPPLYFYTHESQLFKSTLPDVRRLDIFAWRLVGREFTQRFVPDNPLGAWMLKLICWVEETFPRAAARVGYYYMVAIQK
jgi:SAM-dependent methyltransferase